MSRDGSGNYILPSGNPVVPNTVISAGGWANPTMNDIAAAITQSLSKDGQTTPTANLPMGNFRHTSVANAAARTDYAAAGQVQDSALQWLTSVAGTDTITANLVPAITAYAAGQTFRFVSAGANTTTAPTLNINGLGAKAITKRGTAILKVGEILSGEVVEVIYDGTRFQILPLNSVIGSTTNDSANAGEVGEYISASPAAVSLTTATNTNIASISLTAGDWDVDGVVYYLMGSGTTGTIFQHSINTTSATQAAAPNVTQLQVATSPGGAASSPTPTTRISIAATTTVYLVGLLSFSGGTATGQGIIRARRVR